MTKETRIAGRRRHNRPQGVDPALPDHRQGALRRRIVDLTQETTMQIARFIQKFARDEEGVTAIEYGLIASLIAVVIIAAVRLIGTNLNATFNTIAAAL
jgi:pilus assembly protein Flp/PilA